MFSDGDKEAAKNFNVPILVYTADGLVLEYNPFTDKEIQLFEGLPSDPGLPIPRRHD